MTESMLPALRLLQLVSPALPVGAYAYSQGFEAAVTEQWVKDEQSTCRWLKGVMSNNLAKLEVPVMQRIYQALQDENISAVEQWNRYLLASRESAELLMEDRHLGRALKKLLADLDTSLPVQWQQNQDVSYTCMFTVAAYAWSVSLEQTVAGYLYAWCENQVAAAIKIIPLGQTAGQRLLGELMPLIPGIITQGMELADEDIGSVAPGLAMASAWHETQYSRLFRS